MDLIIGDIHGCYKALKKLLKKAKFRPAKDRLFSTGDLVNRGPRSADVIRLFMDLGDRADTVLGNHDLHLLAVACGAAKPKRNDNSHRLLEQADADELIEWLANRPLAIYNPKRDFLLVHASVHKRWNKHDTLKYAGEVEADLRSDKRAKLLKNMYGSEPSDWSDQLKGWQRKRFITNVLTRARFCKKNGALDLLQKGPPGSQSKSLSAWFDVDDRKTAQQRIFFGHWSALGYHQNNNAICLDGGYLWGGELIAYKLKKNRSKMIRLKHD